MGYVRKRQKMGEEIADLDNLRGSTPEMIEPNMEAIRITNMMYMCYCVGLLSFSSSMTLVISFTMLSSQTTV